MACRLSQRVEYAVRSLIELAIAGEVGLSGTQISERARVPNPFLKQILATLVKGNVIESTRGRQGRYRLGKATDTITLYRLLELIEGPIVFYDPSDPPGPAMKALFDDLTERMVVQMNSVSLKDFLEATLKDRKETRPMFFI